MKLIDQAYLEFREGASDKVYEVDLCEVGPDQYVVNFRYGRRGTALRDGSKTPAPVTRARARAIFDALVAEKRGKGYRVAGRAAHAVPLPAPPPVQESPPPPPRTPAPPPPPPPPPPAPVLPPMERDFEVEAAQAAAAPCPQCGKPRRVSRVKKPGANQGRLFLKCGEPQCGFFEWAPTPAAVPAPSPAAVPLVQAGSREQEQGVLRRLRRGYSDPPKGTAAKKEWRLSRAIWRAGEMALRQAEPLLLALLEQTLEPNSRRGPFNRGEIDRLLGPRFWSQHDSRRATHWPEGFSPPEDPLLYVLAWSLGRCGSAASVPALRGLRSRPWEPVGRIATAALLLLLEGTSRIALVEELTNRLPPALRTPCRAGPPEAFGQALQEHLGGEGVDPTAVLDLVYLIDNANVRPALLQVLRTVPLRSACFQSVRHVFKVAELRHDAEVFGILAHRFETEPHGESRFQAQVRVTTWSSTRTTEENATVMPFGKRGRAYFRGRAWRTLERLGALGHLDYVRMAAGVLLPFTDAEADEPELSRTYHACRYWAYNQILYRNSRRYQVRRRARVFICRRPYQPVEPEAAVREEAYPHLWQAQPEVVVRLLEGSRCGPVHRFGVKVLRACPEFCRRLPVADLARLLAAPYEVTQEFGLELAVQRYDPAHPDHELVLALADSGLGLPRAQARTWIDQQRDHFTGDLAFLAALAGSPQDDTRGYARQLLRRTAFTPENAAAMIGRVVALIRTFTAGEGERARDTARTLQVVFPDPLRRVGLPVILDLLDHPLPEVRLFAGELVLGHETFSTRPPEDLLLRLLQDSDASVRGVGVRLLGQLPEAVLKESIDLLVALSRHELADFRANIRPVVKRLADADAPFGQRIALRFAEALLVPGAPEGVPSHTARLLREDLQAHLGAIPAATTWQLLQARSTVAQEVGGLLLAANVRPGDLSLAEIVRLASHDILSVREAAWQMCRAGLDRLKKDMDMAVRLVDAKWEDSRRFAFDLFRDAFHREELTPAVLVSLCDSVRPDVQQFGKEMIARLFAEQDGPEYALKLAEHPSPSMQMFAANFLERYAGEDPGRLRELTFYFQSVLSRVNQGRVARDRVLNFLQKVSQSSAESAAVVAEVLGRVSATVAVGDRARAIEILAGIHAAFPETAMPLRVLPVEVRRGV